ncbi:MAG: site-specific DNA-methyltransferase [Ignavibacteriaceae bacterium]
MPTLQFKGKNIIWNHHLAIPYHTLDEIKELDFSVPKSKQNDNLLIEGDNLTALKALLPNYTNKIDCIYIDPPYNTGNDNGQGKGWIYNDNVNSPLLKEWFGKEVGLEDLTRHDKWCCMMAPRLKLLRELLNEEGAIFISIDDNEVYNLRSLVTEIFGEENFIALLPTIMNLKGNQDEFAFAGTHEYTLVFAKNKAKSIFYEFEIDDEDLDDWEEDNFGFYKKGATMKGSGVNAPREKRPNLFYPLLFKEGETTVATITDEEFKKIYDKQSKIFDDGFVKKLKIKYEKLGYIFLLPVSNDAYVSWRWQRDKVLAEPHNIIAFIEEGTVSLNKKQRPSLGELPSKKPKTIFYKPEYSSGNGTNQLKELFTDKVFNNPKPLELIKDFLTIGANKNSIILDSFAGSGTTAHAVLDLNKEDTGNRKFILVQMPENTETEPEKNICKNITRERIKKAIEKYDYKSGFKYLRVGIPLDAESMLDGKLPTYKQFAKYVYYLCTGENLVDTKAINEKNYFVGKSGSAIIYLVYKQNYEQLTRLALNLTLAEQIKKAYPKKKVIVYAPACFLDEEYLEENQIQFVSIPYNLFQRNN